MRIQDGAKRVNEAAPIACRLNFPPSVAEMRRGEMLTTGFVEPPLAARLLNPDHKHGSPLAR
jgi:hypothetical protein